MNKEKGTNSISYITTISLCILLFLCLCLPAQSQLIKLPFLGIVSFMGFYAICQSCGKVLSMQIWIWLGLYLVYNFIWSALGYVNGQPGVEGYFRLGVIWPIVFLLVIATINKERISWIDKTVTGILLLEVIAVIILIGYGFQWWPNLLTWIFPASKVGIHFGYLHVTGHFIGGMAFTVPYVYCRYIINAPQKRYMNILYLALWFLTILAVVATSRRILLVVLIVCELATVIAASLCKEYRRKMIVRSACGFAVTILFLVLAVVTTSNMSTRFLEANYDELYEVIVNRNCEGSGNIKYIDDVVFDLEGTAQYIEMYETKDEEFISPDSSIESSNKSVEFSYLDGFSGRMNDMFDEFREESVRSKIITLSLKAWIKNPIFGVGFGAEIPEYKTRGEAGIYEMEYVVRLYTTGIVGIAILLGLMLYIGIMGIKQMRKSQFGYQMLAPCLVAYLGAAIATISNPYIFSGFDYLFMLFLPLAYLNCSLKKQSEDKDR